MRTTYHHKVHYSEAATGVTPRTMFCGTEHRPGMPWTHLWDKVTCKGCWYRRKTRERKR